MATEKAVIQQMEEEYPEIAREYKKILKELVTRFKIKIAFFTFKNLIY